MTLLPFFLNFLHLFASPTPYVEPAHPASDVYSAQAALIIELREMYPDVKSDVRWEPCQEENSFYDPSFDTITLCTEMADQGRDVAVGVAGHEFAHALMETRFGYTTEQEADELMALWMVQLHHPMAAIANGAWLRSLDDGRHEPGDPHPGTAFRAWEMTCIVDGGLGEGPAECRDLYRGLKLRYDRRLSTP